MTTPADQPRTTRTTWPAAQPLQQAADIRRAAGDPLLADWLDATANALAWLAPYRDNEPGYSMWEAALAVARQLLGTTEQGDEGAGCAHCGSRDHVWDDCETYTALTAVQADTETAPAVDRAAALTDRERQFLTFALDMAADELSLGAGFTDEDRAALDHLRRLAEAQQPTPAATEEATR